MKSENVSTESETVKLFVAAIDFYICSSKPWEINSLNKLLGSGGFTAEEIQYLTGLMDMAKRELRAELVREQLAKILVGEDMLKGAEDHISRMGAPKPPAAAANQFVTGAGISQSSIEAYIRQKEQEEMIRQSYGQMNYQNQAQALGIGYGSAMQAAKAPWIK